VFDGGKFDGGKQMILLPFVTSFRTMILPLLKEHSVIADNEREMLPQFRVFFTPFLPLAQSHGLIPRLLMTRPTKINLLRCCLVLSAKNRTLATHLRLSSLSVVIANEREMHETARLLKIPRPTVPNNKNRDEQE